VLLENSIGDQAYQGEISGSFGMEFVDINLPETSKPVTVEFTLESSSSAEFHLQILRIYGEEIGDDPLVIESEPLETGLKPGEVFSAQFTKKGMAKTEFLTLIVTRVDHKQTADPSGEYLVQVR
jgi:hypothetical protein